MIPAPTEEYVTGHGGIWVGTYAWPPTPEDMDAMDAFVTPKNHLQHLHLVKGSVTVYTLPWEQRPGKPIPLVHMKGYVTPSKRKSA
jgi:hypothetical protein